MSWLYEHRFQLDGLQPLVEIAHWITKSRVPPEDQDDVEQEIVLELMLTVEKYGNRGKSYLRAVARNRLCNYLRRKYKQKRPYYIEESDSGEKAGEKRLFSHDGDIDARLDAKAILATLPKKLIQIGQKILNGETLSNAEGWYWTKEKKRLNCRNHANQLSEWERRRIIRLHCRGLHVWPIARTLGRSYRTIDLCLIKAGLRKAPREEEAAERKTLGILRKHPEGMTRRVLSPRLNVSVREVDWYLAPLIKQGEVVEIKRENTRGRPRSPLLFIAGAEIQEEKMVKAERDERIRQAYLDGWSIKRINRELHHDKRIIRRAIRSAGTI